MKTKILLLIVAITLLPGCIPAVFVAGAVAGGAIIYDNRSTKTIAEDNKTTVTAQGRIDIAPDLKGSSHILVSTFNHIVLLVGQARTPQQSQTAYNIASAMPGIKRVYNEITIQPPTPDSQRAKDTWITTKVKSSMLTQRGLHSSQIKVVTENNVVYLMGLVTHSQSNLAATVASEVNGVQKVVKLFEYLN